MKSTTRIATAAALALIGSSCATTPIASITEIDTEDVTVQVEFDNFMTRVEPEDMQNAAQQEGDRGCGRYDRRATLLSTHLVQTGNQYNGYRTVYRYLFTCG